MSQISCHSNTRAPAGCTQWFTGKTGVNTVSSFNYDNGDKLADQNQIICFRYSIGI